MEKRIGPGKTLSAVFLVWIGAAIASPAQTFTTLVSFNGANGADPNFVSLVQGFDGALYGTTYYGGTNNDGTVFKITPAGALTTLHSFDGTDGSNPGAGLVLATNGNLYGTTVQGGAYGGGTVFKITPAGALTTLHSFDGSDGEGSDAAMVQATDGNLYGTTVEGGAYGVGTIFKMTPAGDLTTFHSFDGTDGAYPVAGLVQATDGNFYGASGGGSYGTIYKITLGGSLTTLHTFDGTDGTGPDGALVQATNGNFYGTTVTGGANNVGTVFEMTLAGSLTTLQSFTGIDGYYGPYAGLVQATNGNLYGTTSYGGTNNDGTIFAITPAGALRTLHSFDGTDGYVVVGGLVQATNGNIYGLTDGGGANGVGTVFRVSVGLGPFVKTLPTSGRVGAAVTILGTNLTGATSVSFNGTSATFTVVRPSEITTTVPSGATTGEVVVTTPSGGLVSNVAFQVESNVGFLVFPLMNKTASTSAINAVFDHSMDAAPGNPVQFGYCPDLIVTAYTGEQGNAPYPSSPVGDFTCGATSPPTSVQLDGYQQAAGKPFSVNGQYVGGLKKVEQTYLFYDGHPGYDYRTTDQDSDGNLCGGPDCNTSGQTPVLAAAEGAVVCVNISVTKVPPCSEGPGEVKIDHQNGYFTIYLHLSAATVTAGQVVIAQQQIGVSGDTGAAEGGAHLHFEVRKGTAGSKCPPPSPSGGCVPVDPYGWQSTAPDPYTRAVNINLWQ